MLSCYTPQEHTQKELERYHPFLAMSQNTDPPNGGCASEYNPGPASPQKWKVFLSVLGEQMINAGIVGGIAALSAWDKDPWIGLKAFGLTFLFELRKYRKL